MQLKDTLLDDQAKELDQNTKVINAALITCLKEDDIFKLIDANTELEDM